MNPNQIEAVMRTVKGTWSNQALGEDAARVYVRSLAPLDYDDAMRVLDNCTAEFRPTPPQLRQMIIERGFGPLPDIDDVIAEVQRITSEHGYYQLTEHGIAVLEPGEEPPLDRYGVKLPYTRMPAAAEFIRQRGIDECCSAPDGRATTQQEASAFATWRAQALASLRSIVSRERVERVNRAVAELQAREVRELEEGDE